MTARKVVDWTCRARRVLLVISSAVALQACTSEWGVGLQLPPGDAGRGREAFVELRCHACHQIKGFDPPTPIVAETRVALGGQTARVKTYGDLVTSIVNPTHRLARGYPREAITVGGESVMSYIYLNELLTVQQLVDIVAFLESDYEVVPPPIRYWENYPSDDGDSITRGPLP
jgi:L-cysteine S-thiosulfotransferase